jgi:hypothetical protein
MESVNILFEGFQFITETKYKLVFINSERNIFLQIWKENTNEMTTPEFIEEAIIFFDLAAIHNPLFIVTDQRKYLRKYTEEEKIWYFKKLAEPKTFLGVKKFSTVQNEDLLSAIQVEEMGKIAIQFSHLKNIEFRVFHSIEEAMLWSK